MYQLTFYVPSTHLEKVKSALFEKGAGKYRAYDCCAWQCKGEGQFRPLEGSNPFIGESGKLEKVEEYKVEMIVTDECVEAVVKELIKVHPYEEPAYALVKLEILPNLS